MTETDQNDIFKEEIRRCTDTMRRGGVILYPTDTLWGIGCDATRSNAVRRVFEIKHRADSKALISLVDSLAMLERHVETVPGVAYQLIDLSDRPLTIVYDRGINLAPELLAGDGSVGIRLTRERFSAALCHALRRPIVSTSANLSGERAARYFDEISPEIREQVDYIANWRRDDRRPAQPSSVMRLSEDGTFKILRP
ncbi:MAG: L-threonylcarbamoyladenylate synthase [Clostridium sp.]|nr:L-threonylcarbamoyladenylate synthase [Clostridium sp.]